MIARNEVLDDSKPETRTMRSVQVALGASVFVIFVALAANIVMARMSRSELNDLPFCLSLAYYQAGTPGVTLAIIATGFAVILLGLLGERVAVWFGRLLYGPRIEHEGDCSPSSGSSFMELTTAKYLGGHGGPEAQPDHDSKPLVDREVLPRSFETDHNTGDWH
jgi:hypothetical protein